MTQDKKLDRFEKLVSNKPSSFLSKFAEYKKNKKWIERSSEIAVNILEALKDKKISQKDLAEKLEISAQQVNKIIKGQQNLTLETIAKIEGALDISLLQITDYRNANIIEVKPNTVKAKSILKTKEQIIPNVLPQRIVESFYSKKTSMKVVYKGLQKEYLNAG